LLFGRLYKLEPMEGSSKKPATKIGYETFPNPFKRFGGRHLVQGNPMNVGKLQEKSVDSIQNFSTAVFGDVRGQLPGFWRFLRSLRGESWERVMMTEGIL